MQTESLMYTNIFGVKQRKSPGKTTNLFQMYQLLHLRSCFSHDAGKNLRFYILNCLKKPNKVQLRQFMWCMLQLNNCREDLLHLYYIPSTSSHTQRVYSFMDLELTCNILRMCPLNWQDRYHLLEKCYLEGVKPPC